MHRHEVVTATPCTVVWIVTLRMFVSLLVLIIMQKIYRGMTVSCTRHRQAHLSFHPVGPRTRRGTRMYIQISVR